MQYTFLQKIQIWFIRLLTKFHWEQKHPISSEDKTVLKEKLAKDYYVIATRKSNYATTFLITLGHFFLTRKWGFYSHVLMNLEDTVKTDDDYRFIEATNVGVKYSDFDTVFGAVDAVALIKPKSMTIDEWTAALDRSKTYFGRPYDNLFDLKSDREINCVELVRLALSGNPNYKTDFIEFEKLVEAKKKLTPDMFAQCSDFEIAYTVRKK